MDAATATQEPVCRKWSQHPTHRRPSPSGLYAAPFLTKTKTKTKTQLSIVNYQLSINYETFHLENHHSVHHHHSHRRRQLLPHPKLHVVTPLSIINCQLSIINCQLSIINYQLSTVNYQLSIINCQLSIINYQLSIINYQLDKNNCRAINPRS